MDTMKAILSRRSIRKYTGEPVSREDLTELVKAGMSAPTSRDTRHFCFVVIDDVKLIEDLIPGLPNAQMLASAKHAIVVASDLDVAYGGFEIDYWLQDCSAACENILLAAKAKGFGACWTGVHPREERVDFLKTKLNMPQNIRPMALIVVGKQEKEELPRDKFDPNNVFFNSCNN